ncbi:MAG: hypothetical protein JWN84_1390 [Nocardioides sp.]|jgi:hypothetical protein|nr:hypothetical protein [Nocardioides sp.]
MSQTSHGGHDSDDDQISYAEVAAEDSDVSVAREGEAVDESAERAGGAPGEQAPEPGPGQPTTSSLMSGGPVGEGDELAP